ncbi:MAG: hypothetical protein OEN56_15405 [Gemmatimonadota bacterium]|nr:hypothetical protein [Gemmatimonadota bacterium]
MSNLRSITALICLIVFAACDSPTLPEAAPPEAVLVAGSGSTSSGAPVNDRQFIDFTIERPCQTFTLEQHFDLRQDTKTWVNADGSTRTLLHLQGRFTATNLTTGDWAANDIVVNEEALASADGLVVEFRNSGISLKVRREAKGRQIAYGMGHATVTIDFSTDPPTFLEPVSSGRSFDGPGPCVELGDPTQ